MLHTYNPSYGEAEAGGQLAPSKNMRPCLESKLKQKELGVWQVIKC
jgi:hypothetical protein